MTYVPEEGDEPAHLDCVLQEMGEIQAARTALERSETRLRLAVEGSGSGMWDHDLARAQTVYSPTVARMVHYTGDDFSRDFRMRERLHPDDSERVRLALQYALTSGEPFVEKLRLQCFDGNYRWFMARGVRHLSDAGQPERFSGILTDLTRERQIDERQRLAATVMENMSEGVIVTDTNNRILSVNASVTRLLGYTEEELLGKTPRVFKSDRHDRAFYQAMWESMKRTGRWQGEIWNRRKNGEVFPEHMSMSVARDAAGTATHYVCMFTDISDEKAQHQRMEYLANNDALTGLSNRLWFCGQLEDAVVQARGNGERMAVLQLNLDRFKDVNDSYGHAIGDQVLKDIARRVQAAMRPGDLLGRMAGDELAVVARHLRHADGAAAVARQLIAAVAEPWRSPEGFEVVAGVSVGICMFPEHAATAQTLLQGAHAAALESRLRLALAHGHMVLHYQPQIDIATGRIVGAEALVRWNDPEEGLIPPGRFIPVAEVSGIIGPLGEWIIGEACRQGQRWREEGLPALTVAVNVSPRQFQLTDLVGCTASALRETGFPAAMLELEITESALAEREDEALLTMRRLRDLGLRLAVDDFGTGYSSLAQLKRFPIDVLKIDQGFIRDIPQSSDDMAISAAIIAMGHSMDLRVLAEGVETAEQLAFLRERGCDSYQGYFCSRPVPAESFAALVRAQQAR
ncbi:EAL domain-containing protein [Acidovorax sp. 28-64-14]|uniref:putative bifunctional diguanylate cyclase/phosphodiesterase n=1 Tax=Acidovorax sp. 28-64-14 TaxID=1970310 RepID=UPI00345222C9